VVGARPAVVHGGAYTLWRNPVRPHWPSDVLDDLLTYVLEGVRKPLADMVTDGARDAHPARLGQSLQSRRDVHAVTKYVVWLDDRVSEVDSAASASRAEGRASAII
jgi:hypothetical protein